MIFKWNIIVDTQPKCIYKLVHLYCHIFYLMQTTASNLISGRTFFPNSFGKWAHLNVYFKHKWHTLNQYSLALSHLKPVSHEADECIIMRLLMRLGTVIIHVSMLTARIRSVVIVRIIDFKCNKEFFQTSLFICAHNYGSRRNMGVKWMV